MKASEMVKFLEESIKKYGDLDIVTPKYEKPDSLYPYYDEICDCSWGYETDINGNKVREFIEIF